VVHLLSDNTVRIIQVTRAQRHTMKLKYAVLLLRALQKAKYIAKRVEFIIIKPSTNNLPVDITIEGQMEEFKNLWNITDQIVEYQFERT